MRDGRQRQSAVQRKSALVVRKFELRDPGTGNIAAQLAPPIRPVSLSGNFDCDGPRGSDHLSEDATRGCHQINVKVETVSIRFGIDQKCQSITGRRIRIEPDKRAAFANVSASIKFAHPPLAARNLWLNYQSVDGEAAYPNIEARQYRTLLF